MSTKIKEQDLRDWVVAYRNLCIVHTKKCRGWSFELRALTRLGQLAGLFAPQRSVSLPLKDDIYALITRKFNNNLGLELSIQATDYSNATGLKLKITTDQYRWGDNFDLFAVEMGKFMQKLPLGGVGSFISANVLEAICAKIAPEAIREKVLKKIAVDLTGTERSRAEKVLPMLLRKCACTVIEHASHPEDPYLLELDLFCKNGLFVDDSSQVGAMKPVFGLSF